MRVIIAYAARSTRMRRFWMVWRQLGNCPETGLEDDSSDVLEADYWIVSFPDARTQDLSRSLSPIHGIGERYSSPERRPFQSDINCEDRHYGCAQNDGCDLLERVNGIQTCYNHSDAPYNIRDQEQNGDRRCPLPHGQNEQPGYRVESPDRRAQVGRGRDLGSGEAKESVSETGRQLRKAEDNVSVSLFARKTILLPGTVKVGWSAIRKLSRNVASHLLERDFGPASKSAIKCRIRSAVTQAEAAIAIATSLHR